MSEEENQELKKVKDKAIYNLKINSTDVNKCENIACVQKLIDEYYFNMIKELKEKQVKAQSPKLKS